SRPGVPRRRRRGGAGPAGAARSGGVDRPGASGVTTIPGYELEALIGRGASSTVWRAAPAGGGPPVAVKRVRRPGDVAALAREAEALAAVGHPNLLRVHGTVPDGDGI